MVIGLKEDVRNGHFAHLKQLRDRPANRSTNARTCEHALKKAETVADGWAEAVMRKLLAIQ